jgi:hypothetical protein
MNSSKKFHTHTFTSKFIQKTLIREFLPFEDLKKENGLGNLVIDQNMVIDSSNSLKLSHLIFSNTTTTLRVKKSRIHLVYECYTLQVSIHFIGLFKEPNLDKEETILRL